MPKIKIFALVGGALAIIACFIPWFNTTLQYMNYGTQVTEVYTTGLTWLLNGQPITPTQILVKIGISDEPQFSFAFTTVSSIITIICLLSLGGGVLALFGGIMNKRPLGIAGGIIAICAGVVAFVISGIINGVVNTIQTTFDIFCVNGAGTYLALAGGALGIAGVFIPVLKDDGTEAAPRPRKTTASNISTMEKTSSHVVVHQQPVMNVPVQPAGKFCFSCGAKNDAGAKFCSSCAKAFPE